MDMKKSKTVILEHVRTQVLHINSFTKATNTFEIVSKKLALGIAPCK